MNGSVKLRGSFQQFVESLVNHEREGIESLGSNHIASIWSRGLRPARDTRTVCERHRETAAPSLSAVTYPETLAGKCPGYANENRCLTLLPVKLPGGPVSPTPQRGCANPGEAAHLPERSDHFSAAAAARKLMTTDSHKETWVSWALSATGDCRRVVDESSMLQRSSGPSWPPVIR